MLGLCLGFRGLKLWRVAAEELELSRYNEFVLGGCRSLGVSQISIMR